MLSDSTTGLTWMFGIQFYHKYKYIKFVDPWLTTDKEWYTTLYESMFTKSRFKKYKKTVGFVYRSYGTKFVTFNVLNKVYRKFNKYCRSTFAKR